MVVIDEYAADLFPGLAPAPEVDERAARRSLRDQIARLERELGNAFVSAFPRTGVDGRVPGAGRPRLGLIGMMMGWWQVKLSSGCPLATGGAVARRPPE